MLGQSWIFLQPKSFLVSMLPGREGLASVSSVPASIHPAIGDLFGDPKWSC